MKAAFGRLIYIPSAHFRFVFARAAYRHSGESGMKIRARNPIVDLRQGRFWRGVLEKPYAFPCHNALERWEMKMKQDLQKTNGKPTGRVGTFDMLQRQIDRLFDDFSSSFGWPDMPTFGRGDMFPAMDMTNGDKAVSVSVELPGVDEKDVDISVVGDSVTISGEKKSETERKEGERHITERSYGSFSRSFSLPFEIEANLVEARFENGVLKLEIGKPAHVKAATRKIKIKH